MRSPAYGFRASLGALALILGCTPVALAQPDVWNGTTDSNWNTPTNWSAGAIPTTAQTALFNNAGNGMTTITLVGMTEQPAGIQFDTASVVSYTIGSTVGDGLLALQGPGSATAGALSITSTVTTAQTINSNILSVAGAPIFFTNLGALGSTNGTPGLTIAGNLTLPISGTLNIVNAANALTLLSGAIGSGGTGTLTVTTNSGSATVRLTGQSTYTAGTIYGNNGTGNIIQVGSSSNALPGSSFTSGPLGTGPLTVNNNVLQAVGADQTISNAIVISATGGFNLLNAPTTGYNADSTGPHNLTLAGPISYASNVTQARTLTLGLTGSTSGNILTFGSAAAPSTITLTQLATSQGTVFKAVNSGSAQLVVLNDVIQDNPTSPTTKVGTANVDTVAYGNNAGTGGTTIFRFSALNTYNGNAVGPGAGTAVGTPLQQPGARYQLNVNTGANTVTTINGTPTGNTIAGPFGSSTVVPNNTTALPILEAYGADRTLANPINLTQSGFIVDSAASLPTASPGFDPSGPHNLTLSGVISGTVATNGLTVQTGGAVTLTNANLYSGTTLVTITTGTIGGKLLASNGTNGSATGTGPVNVNGTGAVASGGTLGGTGTITGPITISSATPASQGGIVAPGIGTTIGTLNVGAMTWQPNGQYNVKHDPTSTSSDLINGIGGSTSTLNIASLGGGNFTLNLVPVNFPASPQTQTTYTIATFTGGITGSGGPFATGTTDVSTLFTYSGSFATMPTAAVVGTMGGPQSLQLTFTPVPEPATVLLLCSAATGAAGWWRRRSDASAKRR